MKLYFALATCVFAAFGTPALAGENTATMQVRATVVESCSVSAAPLEFALDTSGRSVARSQAAVALSCNGPAAYEVALDSGQNSGPGKARRMIDPISGRSLDYEIYADAAYSLRWGNALGIDTVGGTAGGQAPIVLTAYGRTLASDRPLVAGIYSDTVVVSVNF